MKQPKVLVISSIFPPEIGGPATYARSLMDRRGEGLTKVVSFGSIGQKATGVSIIPTAGNFFARQTNLFYQAIKNGIGSDIFLLLDPFVVGLTGCLGGKLLGKKIILKFVGDPGWEKSMERKGDLVPLDRYLGQIPKTDLSFQITKLVLHLVNKIVVPSNYLKETLEIFYGVNGVKITVIPNSVEVGLKPVTKKKNQIVFVGRLQPWKKIDQIVRAFSKTVRFFSKLKLLIIGDGPEEKALKQLVEDLHLEKEINFLGILDHDQVLKVIAESKFLLLYSSYEGLPHVALEAMAAGTLPVLSNIPGNDEVIGSLLVTPNDPHLLAEEMVSLLKDESRLAKLSKEARISAEGKYGWTKNIGQLEKIFSSVMGE